MAQYVRTISQLATALDISRNAIYKDWMEKDGFESLKGAKGWCVDDVAAFMRDYKANKENVRGEHSDLKRQKIAKEVEKLDVQISIMKNELVDKQVLRDEVAMVCGVMLDGLRQLVQKAKLTRNTELVGLAEGLAEDMKRYFREKAKDA